MYERDSCSAAVTRPGTGLGRPSTLGSAPRRADLVVLPADDEPGPRGPGPETEVDRAPPPDDPGLRQPQHARLEALVGHQQEDRQRQHEHDLTEPLGLSQPTVSHHLKKLAEAGIVTGERRGVWTYYRVQPAALASIAVLLTGGRR